MKKTHTTIQMRWGDIDQFGHVYNGYYQHYYDLGKTDYISQIMGISTDWAATGEGFLNAQTTNNYYHPLVMTPDLVVTTTVQSIGSKSLVMFQELIVGSTVHSDSRCVMVRYNSHKGCTEVIPDPLRALCGFPPLSL